MNDGINISVLIPAYNEAELIGGTVDSVHRSFAAVGHSAYEIIVCDNNSTDATAAIARKNGARVVFESHNQIARARNAAANAARGEWLIFLDADTPLGAELLRETIASFRSGKIGAGGAVVRLDADRLPRRIRAIVSTWNAISKAGKLAAGAYLFCRRDAWAETGGFDESFYASEEIWFSRKLTRWCRAHGLRFHIITSTPIVTSARKMQWYTTAQILKQMVRMLVPGAIKNRRDCAHWYTRPAEPALKNE